MTRDEAIKIASQPNSDPADFIDLCVALGMLELDEPQSVNDKIEDAMSHVTSLSDPSFVQLAFGAAGLKIVEK
jgi:hypothetical protein